jgi:hypothetical protein
MESSNLKVDTLYKFYKLYCEQLKKTQGSKSSSLIAQTRTALLRYTLPGFDVFSTSLQQNKDERILENIPISKVKELGAIQQKVFDLYGESISSSIRRTNRSILNKMLRWGELQPWWKEIFETPPRPKASFNKVRVTSRKRQKNYRLTDEEIESASKLQKKSDLENGL